MSDEVLEIFSWDTEEGHLFRVKRESDSWVYHETLARFTSGTRSPMISKGLLDAAVHVLKRLGWSWVEPADVKKEVAHADQEEKVRYITLLEDLESDVLEWRSGLALAIGRDSQPVVAVLDAALDRVRAVLVGLQHEEEVAHANDPE